MSTQNNGQGTIRQARFKFNYPVTYTDSQTSLVKLLRSVGFDGVLYMPYELTTDQWSEAWAQLGNLLCSAAVRGAVQTGYAPT
jgi:hypothetical protein